MYIFGGSESKLDSDKIKINEDIKMLYTGQESWPLGHENRREDPVPSPGSRVELTLMVSVHVSQPQEWECRRAGSAPFRL